MFIDRQQSFTKMTFNTKNKQRNGVKQTQTRIIAVRYPLRARPFFPFTCGQKSDFITINKIYLFRTYLGKVKATDDGN